MEAFLFISLFLLAAVGIGFWFAAKPRRISTAHSNHTFANVPPGRALFANEEAAAEFGAAEAERLAAETRDLQLQRARSGDVSVLAEVQEDVALYRAALNALTEKVAGQATEQANDGDEAALQVLTRTVMQQAEWTTTPRLAQAVIQRPLAFAFHDVLRIAALSGDAVCYQQAVETTLQRWQAGELPRLTAAQLSESIESEYWLLSSEARASGAGFLLKQKLVAVRRELAAVTQRVSS